MTENIVNSDKKFVCVHYPGVVNNVDRALQTLSGLNAIANASATSRNLRLRFNPHNIFTKPIYGQPTNTAGLLIKIKIRRKKKTKEITSISPIIMGKIEKIFEFKGLFDFNFLPMAPRLGCSGMERGDLICILDQLMPKDLPEMEWLNLPAPFCLQPVQFCRNDAIHHIYSFQDSTEGEKMSLEEAMQVSYRESRHKPLARIYFTLTDEFPSKPSDELVEISKIKNFNEADVNVLKKLFDERPIWSLRGLMHRSGLKYGIVNGILPLLSVCYLNGPWRRTHVKFGYDPRKNPQARIYQTVDFRMKNSFHLLPSSPRRRGNIAKSKGISQLNEHNIENVETDENSYIFSIGNLPPKKQMMYQFCDIRVPVVEEMQSRLPALLPGALCHEKTGWLPAGFEDSVRDVLAKIVKEEIKRGFLDKNNKPVPESLISEKEMMDDSSESEDDTMRDEFDY